MDAMLLAIRAARVVAHDARKRYNSSGSTTKRLLRSQSNFGRLKFVLR
jgi:hypothetical protein